ncbi:MAG: hypothetical protein WCO82_06295 [Sphingomonadales bacterium]|jgi:hypothetical protein
MTVTRFNISQTLLSLVITVFISTAFLAAAAVPGVTVAATGGIVA